MTATPSPSRPSSLATRLYVGSEVAELHAPTAVAAPDAVWALTSGIWEV
jgi:hypothetical protein